jgi:hypothetical protein
MPFYRSFRLVRRSYPAEGFTWNADLKEIVPTSCRTLTSSPLRAPIESFTRETFDVYAMPPFSPDGGTYYRYTLEQGHGERWVEVKDFESDPADKAIEGILCEPVPTG